MDKIILIIFVTLLYSCSTNTLVSKNNSENNKFEKKDIIVPAVTLINPALAFSSLISNSDSLFKIISLSNIVYTNQEGKSFAENAISQTVNKDCKLEHLTENKDLCE